MLPRLAAGVQPLSRVDVAAVVVLAHVEVVAVALAAVDVTDLVLRAG